MLKKSNVLILCILLTITTFVGYKIIRQNRVPMQEIQTTFTDREKRVMHFDQTSIEVEVVTKPESITLGLSGREEIGADGMLFVLPERRIPSFWMPDMKFDIDIVWIDTDTVLALSEFVPKPKLGQTTLSTYSPPGPVDLVLELPAGMAATLGIKAGTRFRVE